MRMSRSRVIAAFFIGSAVNVVLFCLSKYLGFPLWLDYSGSLYVAALCGPMPALLSAAIHTVMLTALIDGAPALWMMLPLFLCCLVLFYARMSDALATGIGKTGVVFALSAAGFLGTFLPVIIHGAPGRFSGYAEAFSALSAVCGRFFAAIFFSGAAAFCFYMPSALIALGLYTITPKPKGGLSFKK